MRIIVDTREQCPLDFRRWPDVAVEVAGLPSGDYALKGLETLAACERKSIDDLVGSLSAGRDRFEAAKMLGWDEIDAFVAECSEDDAKAQRMIEITENLHRAELTAGERARLIAEWTELTGEKVRQVDAPAAGGKQPREQGIRKTARELGLSEPDVRRCMKIASLSPEAQAVAVEEGLDNNRSALLDAAKHRYRSRMLPHAVLQSLFTYQARYGVPTIWAGDRAGAAYAVRSLLGKYLRERQEGLQAILKAHGEAEAALALKTRLEAA